DVIPGASTRTYRAVGVPATVSGLALALGKYGTIPLERALAPAIRLADEGFIIDRGLGRALKWGSRRLERYPASKAIFYHDDRPLAEGERLVQKDLARTLSSIARQGPRAFYEGRIARTLARDMTSHGGLITLEDLARYRPILREPVSGSYRSFEVLSAPPSSSGGIALIQMLHMLEPFPLGSMGQNSSAYIHHVAEAMKRAFADRSRWLGDPEFFDVPVKSLTSIPYARRMMRNFEPDRATPAPEAGPGNPFAHEGTTTTHFSVVDDQGSAVSNTYTLNSWFGNGAIVEGLGFLLNNEMDDFSSKPDTPNSYGLIGGEANSIAPNKRMLSSMSPTIVLKKGPGDQKSLYLVLGSPGGPTIITSVLQTMLDVMDFGMELQAAVDAPRFHHQWDPDRLFLDKGGFPRDVIDALVRMGYDVRERSPHGDIQAIQVDRESGWLYGASDPRGWGVSRGY
ncbi:MAG: gamma-glutamyltransferase, partial [Acidobacteriota bacterium]